MKRSLAFIILGQIVALSALPAAATALPTLPVPAQLQQIVTVKTQATRSLQAVLSPVQRRQIAGIGRLTETELDRAFGDPGSPNGSVAKIFSAQRLADLAASLRTGQMPAATQEQMGALAQFMGNVLLQAAPTWQRHASQVDALLSPQQRIQIDRLRAATLVNLPHFSFMGFDVFGALGDGSPMGGFLTDPGSFALALSLPNLEKFIAVPREQARQP
ncbi:MAG: hypothetical protein M3Y18_06955 [Candidatus Eremiobacteraeota bacterium]|nr:hypothetical protein [Candidatus Eremiobacteraeota bacterium]